MVGLMFFNWSQIGGISIPCSKSSISFVRYIPFLRQFCLPDFYPTVGSGVLTNFDVFRALNLLVLVEIACPGVELHWLLKCYLGLVFSKQS